MSYAIIRNDKLTRGECIGRYNHNERKTKNHSNKNIDNEKTFQNYYIKKNELSYVKEFDKIKEEYNLKGQIKTTSKIMCEMIFTSDSDFFSKIGTNETKRFFEESYNFICNYKNLGKQNIVYAVVHLDEETPHMHLMYIPVVHTKDSQGNNIDKISCRDFWKGKDSYRKLQDSYHSFINSKGFNLDRGKYSEKTNRKHLDTELLKEITNFEETKEILNNIQIELPNTAEIKDIKKFVINRDEKIQNDIIKPRDELINKLYNDNIKLNKTLSKQVKLISRAESYQADNIDLLNKNKQLTFNYEMLEQKFKIKTTSMEKKIKTLEKSLIFLTNKFELLKTTFKTFLSWVVSKFSNETESKLIKDFSSDKNIDFDIIKNLNSDNKFIKNNVVENDIEL